LLALDVLRHLSIACSGHEHAPCPLSWGEGKIELMRTASWYSISMFGITALGCTGAVDGATDNQGAEHALATRLVGSFEHLALPGTCHELDSLTFERGGAYRAQKADGSEEAGSFFASPELDALTLVPEDGEAREYMLETDEELSALQLSWDSCAEVLASSAAPSTPGCETDADCGEGQACHFAETGSSCVAKGGPSLPENPEDQAACDERTGGALITFSVHGETLKVWSENLTFIAEAKKLVGNPDFHPTPVFKTVRLGHDACSGREWSVDPAEMSFGDFTTEVCDGMPSYLDANIESWVKAPGNYCPWGPEVLAVDER
jgi:hypothetical protein